MVGRESARQPVSQSLTTLTRTEEPQRKKGREGRMEGGENFLGRWGGREGRGNERGMSLSMSLCLMHSGPDAQIRRG